MAVIHKRTAEAEMDRQKADGSRCFDLTAMWRAAECPMNADPAEWLLSAVRVVDGLKAYYAKRAKLSGEPNTDWVGPLVFTIPVEDIAAPYQDGDIMAHYALAALYARFVDAKCRAESDN